MSSHPTSLSSADGRWVDRWLSQARLSTYLAATDTRARALELYEWNNAASIAAHHDIAHIEVALRNAYNNAIEEHWQHHEHWTAAPAVIFAPVMRRRGRVRIDINTKNRALLTTARTKVGGHTAPPGKVIAELTFGFWRFLTTGAHEKTLWVPYLHHAFAPATDRARDVDTPVRKIYDLRNRIAHHEPLIHTDLTARAAEIVALATLLSPDLGQYLSSRSTLAAIAEQRPTLSPPR